jgi:hypothetical protein
MLVSGLGYTNIAEETSAAGRPYFREIKNMIKITEQIEPRRWHHQGTTMPPGLGMAKLRDDSERPGFQRQEATNRPR